MRSIEKSLSKNQLCFLVYECTVKDVLLMTAILFIKKSNIYNNHLASNDTQEIINNNFTKNHNPSLKQFLNALCPTMHYDVG